MFRSKSEVAIVRELFCLSSYHHNLVSVSCHPSHHLITIYALQPSMRHFLLLSDVILNLTSAVHVVSIICLYTIDLSIVRRDSLTPRSDISLLSSNSTSVREAIPTIIESNAIAIVVDIWVSCTLVREKKHTSARMQTYCYQGRFDCKGKADSPSSNSCFAALGSNHPRRSCMALLARSRIYWRRWLRKLGSLRWPGSLRGPRSRRGQYEK